MLPNPKIWGGEYHGLYNPWGCKELDMAEQFSLSLSFRIDWFDLRAVQVTHKSFLQHHNLKTSILQYSAFFMVQLLHPQMTTDKTTSLTRWTLVGKAVPLLFNRLSRFIITFLQRSNSLLIYQLQSPSAVILKLKKGKSATVFTFFFSYICHEVMGTDAMILDF